MSQIVKPAHVIEQIVKLAQCNWANCDTCSIHFSLSMNGETRNFVLARNCTTCSEWIVECKPPAIVISNPCKCDPIRLNLVLVY